MNNQVIIERDKYWACDLGFSDAIKGLPCDESQVYVNLVDLYLFGYKCGEVWRLDTNNG